jgi:hypothetical protein
MIDFPYTNADWAGPDLIYAVGRRNFYSWHPPSAVRGSTNCHFTVSSRFVVQNAN